MRCKARPLVFEKKLVSSLPVLPSRSLPVRVAGYREPPSSTVAMRAVRRCLSGADGEEQKLPAALALQNHS